MALPKYKQARSKTRKRRAQCYLKISEPAMVRCSHCHKFRRAHHACPHCGYYGGKQVFEIREKKIAET